MIDKVLRVVLVLVLFFSMNISHAQPIPDGPPPPNPVPITGIELLIGAGALLGAKRMLSNRKTNT